MNGIKDWWPLQALSPEEAYSKSYIDETSWAGPRGKLEEHGTLRVQYSVYVDLYKYYLDIGWKAVIWYYTVTGALLAYFLKQEASVDSGLLRLLLLFLAVLSLGFAYTYYRGGRHLFETIKPLEYIARTLGLPGRPHMEFAVAFLVINALMALMISIASLVLFIVRLTDPTS